MAPHVQAVRKKIRDLLTEKGQTSRRIEEQGTATLASHRQPCNSGRDLKRESSSREKVGRMQEHVINFRGCCLFVWRVETIDLFGGEAEQKRGR